MLLLALGRTASDEVSDTGLDAEGGTDQPAVPVPVGHARMLGLLDEIARSTDENNHWLGRRSAELARRRLNSVPAAASAADRFPVLTEVAVHELRLGNERRAIELLETAYGLLPELGDAVSGDAKADSVFRLGVAYLRYGESQNCALRHTSESCILPIRGTGIHVDEEGSTQAVRYFLEVLEKTPSNEPLHLKALWLANFAAMTLGRYPEGLPPRYRIPPEIFASEEESFPRFENVAPDLGLATFNLSGGVVFDDFTGDGLLDLFTTTFDTRGEPHFFRNQGPGSEGRTTFVDRTREAGLSGLYGGLNVVQADYDNDGDLDLYILRGAWLASAGRHPNSLLRNEGVGPTGDVTFVDVTFEAGLGEGFYPTQTASWADYDNDGDVDLYVGNEYGIDPSYGSEIPSFEAKSQLFRNNGDGSFTDVAEAAGVAVRGLVKGVVWGDYDNDRFPDLYVSIVRGENRLFRSLGAGSDGRVTFEDVAPELGVTRPLDSFPVWFWDFDNDGALDLYAPSYRGGLGGIALVAASYFGAPVPYELSRLYRGDGRGGFQEVSERVGLTRLHLVMGSNFGDLDNDGYLDFYLGTGYPDYEALMPNVLYHNQGGERFADVTLGVGFGHLQKGHAVAFADFDNDGDQDVFAQMGGAFPGDRFSDALFLNPGFGHHWLTLQLIGTRSNRAAIGARLHVVVEEDGKERSVFRHVNSGGSFGGNPLRQTLGLGKATSIKSVQVYWPASDLTQHFENLEMDRFYRLTEGEEHAVEW